MKYRIREEQVRAELTQEEAIRRIQNDYSVRYDAECSLDAWDQLLACEAVAEATPVREKYFKKEETNGNVSVNGSDNGSCKRNVNFELTQSKLQAISKLKVFNYRTPPKEIAGQLEILFQDYPSKSSHWPFIAQNYTPRTINRVIHRMIKSHRSGRSFLNPSAYFTELIKHRKKRKSL